MSDSRIAWAPVPIRLVLALGFLIHGWPKVFTAAGNQQFQGMLQGIGVPMPGLMSYVTGGVEVLGGLALLLGVWASLASIPLIIINLVAMFTVHMPNGFSFIHVTGMGESGPIFGMPGYEVNLLYIGGLLVVALMGPGAMSLRPGKRESRDRSATL